MLVAPRSVKQRNLINKLLLDRPKIIGKGTDININNSAKLPMELNIRGNLSQETGSVDKNINISNFNSGSIDSEGIIIPNILTRGISDKINCDFKTATIENISIENLRVIIFCYKDNSFLGWSDNHQGWRDFPLTFNVIEGTNKIIFAVKLENDESLTNILSNIKLNLKVTYSTPSIDYPSPVKYVTGEFESYNLVDFDKFSKSPIQYNVNTIDKNTGTVTSITLNNNSACFMYWSIEPIVIKANTQLTIKFKSKISNETDISPDIFKFINIRLQKDRENSRSNSI